MRMLIKKIGILAIIIFFGIIGFFAVTDAQVSNVSQVLWRVISGEIRTANSSWAIRADGDLIFHDEIKPDGDTCANGEILKKTGADDWDCAADNAGGGGLWTDDGLFTYLTSETDDLSVGGQGIFAGFYFDVGLGLASTTDLFLAGNATTTGDLKVKGAFRLSDQAAQTLDANSTVTSTVSMVVLDAASDIILTGLPNVATGTPGQILIMVNVGTKDIEFQDHANLSGSSFHSHAGNPILSPEEMMTIVYEDNSLIVGWSIQSHPNIAVGGDATSLNVRNTSGSSIAKGKVVYATGFTANRTTIDLADADDPAKMPAIGITVAAIGNNGNGIIITEGNYRGVDTSGFSVGDQLYVDTTAGDLVNARPSVDQIQKFGEVLSSQSNGRILISGAGRTNDVPWNFLTTNATSTNLFATSIFKLPFGTGVTVDDGGEMALDTSDNQLLLVDSGGIARVFAFAEQPLFAFILPSTSPDLISGGIIDIPKWTKDGRDITQFRCHVDAGTSVVVNISDGTNDTETITCATTQTSDTDVSTNSTFTADELWEAQIGTVTGSVDYLIFEAYGYITRE